MPNHVHLLLSIPPKYSVSSIMGYLKGKSALMMFDKHANLKYKFGNRHFWAEGYLLDITDGYLVEQQRLDPVCGAFCDSCPRILEWNFLRMFPAAFHAAIPMTLKANIL